MENEAETPVEPTEAAPATEPQVAIAVVADSPVPPRQPGAAALVPIGSRGVSLTSLEDLIRFGRMAVDSGLCPKSMANGNAAAIAIQSGLERGMTPIAALQSFVVINGNLSVKGAAAHGWVENSPVCVPGTLRKFIEGEGDDMAGVAVARRKGYAQAERRTFSVADAKRAGLWKKAGPWTQYPDRMLMWRAEGHLFTDVFPDVIGNYPLAEVAEDFDVRETTRGDTPASRVASGIAPAPGADPLASIIEGELVSDDDIPEGMR